MSDEAPDTVAQAAAPNVSPPAEHAPIPWRRRPWVGLARWLGELATVFVGVYAAFLLSNHASQRRERQRRGQLLTWVEEHYGAVLNNSRAEVDKLHGLMGDFDAKVAAGQMPEIKPISWRGDYDVSDSLSVLQSGGYELLEIDTIRDIRDVESTLRQLVSTAVHAQSLSDAMILPHRDGDPAVFYDPATHRLRESYAWVGKVHGDLAEDFEALRDQCEKLLTQVRADRAHGR